MGSVSLLIEPNGSICEFDCHQAVLSPELLNDHPYVGVPGNGELDGSVVAFADICSTGSIASFLVLGTVQVLPSRWMMLLKSCFMLLSLMKVVPPIAVQWRCCVTRAQNLSG